MLNKYIKIITVNLAVVLLSLLLSDYMFYRYIKYNHIQNCIKQNYSYDKNIRYKTYDIDINKKNIIKITNIYKYFLENGYYRKPIFPNIQHNRSPIILFGCSYTYRHNDDGFQMLLSKYTSRPVFNFAYDGWGAHQMYFIINNSLLYKIIENYNTPAPEYAIYTYIRDHKNRLTLFDVFNEIEPNLSYKIENGKLEVKKYGFINRVLYRLFLYRYLMKKCNEKMSDTERYEIIYNLIVESNNKLKLYYPKIKFVVLNYCQDEDFDEQEQNMFKKLEENETKIISTKSLTNENLKNKIYTDADGFHPNAEAWNLIIKPFLEKI